MEVWLWVSSLQTFSVSQGSWFLNLVGTYSHIFTFLYNLFARFPQMAIKTHSKRPWTEDEDLTLKRLYQTARLNKWSLIAQQLDFDYGFSGRTGKQCRERYNNHLDPNLNREEWSLQEQEKLFQLHDQLGNKWAVISHRLGIGRTDNSVKNHFFSKLRKSLRRLNKLIQQKYKKEIREIQTKVLYKILEASEQKFKSDPMCEAEISENGCRLKNKILRFSYEEEHGLQKEEERAKELILQIISFNKNYKRKPKKYRKVSAYNHDTLEVPKTTAVKRANSNQSFEFSSRSFVQSNSNFESDQQWQDDIEHRQSSQKVQKQKIISPIVLRSQAHLTLDYQPMLEEALHRQIQEGEQKKCMLSRGQQILQELGLLQELDAAVHPSLMKKSTSLFSRRSSEMQEEDIKFFEDSEMEMRIHLAPVFPIIKRESCEDRLFYE